MKIPGLQVLDDGSRVRLTVPVDRILRHECRHVHQFEQAGCLKKYLSDYLQAALERGYFDSPFEQDARLFETRTINDI